MKTKTILITAIALVAIWTGVSSASERKISLSLSKTKVAPGRQVQLSLVVTGGALSSAPMLPYIDGLNIRYKATTTDGSVTTHIYTVAALKNGQYRIGPLTFKEKGDTFISDSAVLEVAAGAPAAEVKPQEASTSEKDLAGRIFLDVSVSKKEAYINELIPVHVKFCSDWLDVVDLNIADVPNKRYITDKYAPESTSFIEKSGERFIVIGFKKAFYVPEAGDFTFGPVVAQFTVTRRQEELLNDNEYFYDKFVGKKGSRTAELVTGVYTVKVVPLPVKGRPDGFKGAIGNFALELETGQRTVKPGGTVDLTIRITGSGNLRTVSAPDILPGDGVTLGEPRIKRAEGTVVVSQYMKLDSPSLRSLPGVRFCYFDPDKKEYFTIKKEIANVTIEAPPEAAAKPGETLSVVGEKEKQAEGLVGPKDRPGTLVEDTARAHESGWFIFFQILPLAVLVIWAAARERRRRAEADTAAVLRLKASKMARTRMRKAKSYMRADKPGEFYAEIFRLMQVYLGTRLSKSPDSVTDEIITFLKAGGDDLSGGKIKEVFADCYVGRYAPAKPDRDDMKAVLDKVTETLESLDRTEVL